MKRFLILFAVVLMALSGCTKNGVTDRPAVVTIQSDEIAFLLDMRSNKTSSTQADIGNDYRDPGVQGQTIQIGNYKVAAGGGFDYRLPESMIIVVSTQPVSKTWDQSSNNMTVRVTSGGSGFVVPVIINANIANRGDAAKYLATFKPAYENYDFSRETPDQWGDHLKVQAKPLGDALDTVVYAKIIEMLKPLFNVTPILKAEAASTVLVNAIQTGMSAKDLTTAINRAGITNADGTPIEFDDIDLYPEVDGAQGLTYWAKEEYGITINTMSANDGVIYDNKEIQVTIDTNSIAIMQQQTLEQRKINEQKQQEIDVIAARTQTLVAQEKAAQAKALLALQEIENSQLIAAATAKAIETGAVVPEGSLPKGLTTLIVTPNYNGFGMSGAK